MKSDKTLARTIYMVDEDESFRTGARQLLGSLGYTVRDHADVESAIRDLSSQRPANGREPCSACMLLDVDMYRAADEGLDGSDSLVDPAIAELARREGLPMVFMSERATVSMVLMAFQQGAISFLEKPFDDAVLAIDLERAFLPDAVKHAAYMADVTVKTRANVTAMQSPEKADSLERQDYLRRRERLTDREGEVLEQMMEGKTSKLIARELGLSWGYVQNCRGTVLAKMEAKSTLALLAEKKRWDDES